MLQTPGMTTPHAFLSEPPVDAAVQQLYDADTAGEGYVMNLSRVWAHDPALYDGIFALLDEATTAGGLSLRDRGVLVAATASTRGDSYCALAYGGRLAGESTPETAVAVLTGTDTGLDDRERALARWARQVVADPNSTTPADVDVLREAGYDDGRIFAATAFIALRMAFSTINDALGARPDAALAASLPPQVRAAVTWGRPPAG